MTLLRQNNGATEMVRTRKPGGGRKPIYSKVSTFSTRITAEVRSALEAEAASSGQSISEAAARLLRLALEVKRDRQLDDPIRALGYVIGGIAYFCQSTTEDGRFCDWRTDPSMFEAFRLALATFLERLRPAGEIDTTVEGPLAGSSPASHAEYAFRAIWRQLQAPIEPMSPNELEADLTHRGRSLSAETIAVMSRGAFAWGDVQRALGINE